MFGFNWRFVPPPAIAEKGIRAIEDGRRGPQGYRVQIRN
jgi:hypothetical protein